MSADREIALRAPFPWFGGKSRAADLIWSRLGDVANYVEPFAGSLAVLLSRPTPPGTETVNDLDCYLANFWRALGADPDGVARWATSPVNEADLHARHRWLVGQADFRERMKSDPDYFDVKIAGWWVWGQCCWIGTGWCLAARYAAPPQRGHGSASDPPSATGGDEGPRIPIQIPHLGDAGLHRKIPHLGNAGRGLHRKIPHLGDAGRGEAVLSYMRDLSARLHNVRVACGEWDRVLGPSVTFRHGLTGVVLDPPYAEGEMEYSAGGASTLSAAVRAWAIENGGNPLLRIALCGLDGEHEMPADWECVPWKARGGYGSARRDGSENINRKRERVWFSPHCLREEKGQRTLFGQELSL